MSGAFFGFGFGVVQALVWFFLPQWWVLPFFGFLVGTLTNWIAIQLIFTPVEPKKFGPFIVQGLFLKRQTEISAAIGGALGALVGWGQLVLVFGERLLVSGTY